jgi:hypothetical protein
MQIPLDYTSTNIRAPAATPPARCVTPRIPRVAEPLPRRRSATGVGGGSARAEADEVGAVEAVAVAVQRVERHLAAARGVRSAQKTASGLTVGVFISHRPAGERAAGRDRREEPGLGD